MSVFRSRRCAQIVCAIVLSACLLPHALAAQTLTRLTVQTGHSLVLALSNVTRVAVGDKRIAGVVPLGTTELIVNGKAPGRTTLVIWEGQTRLTYEITVTEQTLDGIATMLRGAITDPAVHVLSFDHAIVVQGAVEDAARFASLSDILSRFDKVLTAEKYGIVNAVTITYPFGAIQRELSLLPGAKNVRLDADTKGDVIVSGSANDRFTAEAILARARGLAGPYLGGDKKIIDRLSVDTVTQIEVHIYVVELDRTTLNQLGLRLQSGTPDPQGTTIVLGAPQFPVLENPKAGGLGKALNIGGFYRTTILAPTLDLIMGSGNARIVSAPDLMTLPGTEATFLVGGEIPIPFASGPGQVAIVYKEFGVKMKLTPTLLGNGSIDTKIAPEVSNLDFQDGIAIGGFTIPALKTSRLSTEVITRPGESIVLGGMISSVEQRTIQKIPLLSSLPILGPLFQSTRFQKGQTDIVFIMTPTVVTR